MTRPAYRLLFLFLMVASSNVVAGFTPGLITGWDENTCEEHGGQIGESTSTGCVLGEVLATYRCDTRLMISVIARPDDHSLLHWTGSQAELANLQTMGGAHWVGKRVVLWERGLAARVVTQQGELMCEKL